MLVGASQTGMSLSKQQTLEYLLGNPEDKQNIVNSEH